TNPSPCASRCSPRPPVRHGCRSFRAAAPAWCTGAAHCDNSSTARTPGGTATPSSCSGTAWNSWRARSSGWTPSSMPNAPPGRQQTLRPPPTLSPSTPFRRRTSIPARKTSHPCPGDISPAVRAAGNDLSNSDATRPRHRPPTPLGDPMSRIRVAIAGLGNCAASLVQGVHFYAGTDPAATVPGLMHVQFGPYHIDDIEFVAAFDVDAKKVGFDIAEAITASENNTIKIADVPPLGVSVQRGPTHDGLGKYYRETIEESQTPAVDVAQALREAKADVLVCYLPVGSEEAAKAYAQAALDAGVAMVNALPVFIASDPEWAAKFTEAGVPIVGDDIKSQVGAT